MLPTGVSSSAICTITAIPISIITTWVRAILPVHSGLLSLSAATAPEWFVLVVYAVSGRHTAEVSSPFNILSDDENSAQDGILSMGIAADAGWRLSGWLRRSSRRA